MRRQQSWASLLFFIVLCLVLEVFAGYLTSQTVSTWYPELHKPSWTPPGWVFGPVWTILYMMIAISGWLIYTSKSSRQRSLALVFYFGQLVLNFMWSLFFFFLKSPISGLIDILLLLLLIIFTIIYAWPVRRLASILLIPYLIWVMYAATLNAGIWWLND